MDRAPSGWVRCRISITVTISFGITVITTLPLIAQTKLLHPTELKAAVSETSRDSYRQTVI